MDLKCWEISEVSIWVLITIKSRSILIIMFLGETRYSIHKLSFRYTTTIECTWWRVLFPYTTRDNTYNNAILIYMYYLCQVMIGVTLSKLESRHATVALFFNMQMYPTVVGFCLFQVYVPPFGRVKHLRFNTWVNLYIIWNAVW